MKNLKTPLVIITVIGLFVLSGMYLNKMDSTSSFFEGSNVLEPGKTATISLVAEDHAPTGSPLTVSPNTVNASFWSGDVQKLGYATNTIGTDSITSGIGKIHKVMAKDDLYYGDLLTFTVDEQTEDQKVIVYKMVAESDIQTTCRYASAILDASSSWTGSDYDLSLIGGASKLMHCEIVNNGDNVVYRVGGLVGFTTNDIQSITVNPASDGIWDEVKVPQHMKTTKIQFNVTQTGGNISAYNIAYKLKEPILLKKNQKLNLYFDVLAGSNDPTSTSTVSDASMFGFILKDLGAYVDSTINPALGISDDSVSGLDVGLDETDVSPQGLQIGMIGQGI